MTKLNSALPAFYFANADFPFTINIGVDLDRPIDRDLLRTSLDQAQTRYPYFSVRVVLGEDGYGLAPNTCPFPLFDTPAGVVLGSPEADGHLIALAAHDSTVNFLAFHGLTDGHGFFPFIKTVLYLYLTAVMGETLDAGVVRLPGEVPFAPEFVDPYPASIPETIEPLGLCMPEKFFLLPESDAGDGLYAFAITLPEDAFMGYTRQSDGSPATMVTAFLFKAIQSLHEDNTSPVTCGMAFDRRGVLQVPETCWNVADVIHLGYEPSMVNLPMTKLATVSRGMVFLQSQPENVLATLRPKLALRDHLLTLSHKERKALLAANFKDRVNTDTFNVSYVGRAALGDMERYITGMSIQTGVAGTGVLIELTAINGRFALTFLQDFNDDRYARRFCELLAAEGIESTCSGPVPVVIPGIQLEP